MSAPATPREGLQLDEHLDFQRRVWRLQRIGWLLFALLVMAAIAGGFGNGPLSRGEARSRDGRLVLEYQRVLRAQAKTRWRFSLRAADAAAGHVDLVLDAGALSHAPPRSITPEPASVMQDAQGLRYRFTRAAGSAAPLQVVFEVEPQHAGRLQMQARTDHAAQVLIGAIVLP